MLETTLGFITVRNAPDDGDALIRSLSIRPDSINEEERSVEAVLATEDPVWAYDLRSGRRVRQILRMDGWQPVDQSSMYDNHPQVDHPPAGDDLRGSVRNQRTQNDQLIGKLFFATDPVSEALWQKVKAKHLRTVSIEAVSPPGGGTLIPAGQTRVVAGKSYSAGDHPLLITTRWTTGEVSTTPKPADPRAQIRAATLPTEQTMNKKLRRHLESIGLSVNATDAEAYAYLAGLRGTQLAGATTVRHRVLLEANGLAEDATEQAATDFVSTLRGDVATESGLLRALIGSTTTAPAAAAAAGTGTLPAAGGTPTPAAAVVPTTTAALPDEATIRSQAITAERARVTRVQELAGTDVPAELVRSAINDGWDENRASREFLTAIRGGRTAPVAGGVAIHSRSHEGDCTVRALTVGLMHRLGTPVIDPNATETIRATQAREAEQGDRYRRLSLYDLCRETLRLAGHAIPGSDDEMIRAAVSTASFSNIFTTNVNARFLVAYQQIADTTVGWCSESDNDNFKTQERFFLGKSADMKKIPRGGTAKDATISDNGITYKLARYGKRFSVDEQDIIDDNYSALRTMPTEMGEGCGRLRPSLVYSLLLSNPKMSDGVALFHATHGNLLTGAGSALQISSMETAVQMMGKQTQDGVSLNLTVNFAIVPQDNRFNLKRILRSGETRNTTSNTEYGTSNPLIGEDIIPVSDNRIGVAGVTDPRTEKAVAGTATNWFLATRPNGKTIEVGYLSGTGRMPVVRPYNLTEGRWGIGWDIKHDIEAALIDWRGLFKSDGNG